MTRQRHPILYLMAADAEYGAALRSRIDPVMIGVGPVEAAINTTRELARRREAGSLPQLVVSLGSAGSNRLRQGGVYQARSVSYRDMDASPLGFPRGVTPFLDLPAELPLSPILEGLETARLSTGANIVSGTAYETIDADMVDMETFAILRACQAFTVGLIALRGISDGAEDLGRLEDWTRYLHIVDEGLAGAVDLIEAAYAAGRLD
ncbi:5'-methylthioadenosine/S-adenosylhomocysteine nucleosidase [Arsenicitalea aurantiaca]|uniref:5'-methylthioadenosine/S-adenosylhomocysteine nucleosidase n=1 Tax=Arsenicitalea aurantiaca TaxID=1783274 RepID=A0A433XFB2_9HYPH|nr:5'-methylthioadenosine/S-adenosylhomocysteine nucleosidase [Arsenicitalea aurantiaca]RUT32775.1 5'-methylthioadenosine/S-adenosylhomocysteine nucleosidase [Arsenicitalea aurantiaca]